MEVNGHLKVNQHSKQDHTNLHLVLNSMKHVSMVKVLRLVKEIFRKHQDSIFCLFE